MLKNSHRAMFLALAVAAAAMAGCASNGSKENASTMPASGSESGINTNGNNNAGAGNGSAMNQNMPDLSQHSVYFDFDKSNIKPKYQPIIDNWSKYLMAHQHVHVQLQGNTDERGSREYNMALGERRAESVEKAMEAEGVSSSQLSTISYGKERPVCTEHDEACWKQNRRTDIVEQ